MDCDVDITSILLLLKLQRLLKRRNEIKKELERSAQLIQNDNAKRDLKTEDNVNIPDVVPKFKRFEKVYNKKDLLPTTEYVPRPRRKKRKVMEICDLCGIETLKQNMEYHLNAHFNLKPFTCDIMNCRKSFASPSTLFRHKKLHTNKKDFLCDLCPATFHFNGNLQKHRNTHFQAQFKCMICENAFRTANRLKTHSKTHSESEKLDCTEPNCKKKLKNSYCLRDHLRRFHKIKVRERVPRIVD